MNMHEGKEEDIW